MTVADIQKYLHGLADAVSSAANSTDAAREIREAADTLGAFAPLGMPEFTQFLRAAWQYRMTGVVTEPTARPPLLAVRGPDDLLAVIASLCDAASTVNLDERAIRREFDAFQHLDIEQLQTVADRLGMRRISKHNPLSMLSTMRRFVMVTRNQQRSRDRSADSAERRSINGASDRAAVTAPEEEK